MEVFKRAMRALIGQSVKSLLLFLLITSLGSALLSGMSMSRAMIVTEENLLMQLPAVATLVYEGDLNFGWGQPTKEEMTLVGNLPYVRAFDFVLQVFFYSQELSWINTMDPGYFTARGVNNPAITDIESGLISLFDGRAFTQEEIDQNAHVMVISRSIAAVNDLTVGSMIEISNIAHDYRWNGDWSDRFNEEFVLSKQMLEFEVIGIYTSFEEEGEAYFLGGTTFFYLPFGVAENMHNFRIETLFEVDEETFSNLGQGSIEEVPYLTALYVLNSPRDLESFFDASFALLPDDWTTRGIDESIFAPIASSMDIMLELANGIQFVLVIASIIILTLLLLLFLRDRRHEIGIYIALGEKRAKIILQILLEVSVVSLVGFVSAILIGYIFSQRITSFLFEQHLIEHLDPHFFSTGVTTPLELANHVPHLSVAEIMALFDVTLGVTTVLVFVSLGLILVIISTTIPVWYALKLKPKDLLLQAKIG